MDDKVYGWRKEQLVLAGLDEALAVVLALDTHVDLHEALEMLAAGCSPKLLIKILH